jgi:transcriptional regulator with XRE-family HTH domain
MEKNALARFRVLVSDKMRRLRVERHWTQVRFAGLLGLSQNRLSELERGKGSFTAEQLFVVLRTFNVQADDFLPEKETGFAQLQNALARLGAKHLREDYESVPSERLKEAGAVILEALISAQFPRHITALAPVIVAQADSLNFNKLRLQFSQTGFEYRLGWVLESTLEAVRLELPYTHGECRTAYRRVITLLQNILAGWRPPEPAAAGWEDILDHDLLTAETLHAVKINLSPVAKKWGIITRIGTGDFTEALRGARGVD